MTSKTYTAGSLTIKTWAEEDRPREKMLLRGRHTLTDAELLALLLGSGNREETAVGLAQRILSDLKNDLHELALLSPADLMRYEGIGRAKAVTVAAALELGRRRQITPVRLRPQVRSSRDAYQALAATLGDLQHEEFWMLCLNRGNRIVSRQQISSGGTSGTVVDAKIVFRRAIEQQGVAALILAHNHPSGNLQPSQVDIHLTRKLVQAGKTLDLLVVDHLIITQGGYYSFADEGLLQD